MCERFVPGCTDSRAENYDPAYTLADASCSVAGCMDCTGHAEGCTVDAAATFDVACLCDGTCARGRRLEPRVRYYLPSGAQGGRGEVTHGSSRSLSEFGSGSPAVCWDPTATNYHSGASGGEECTYARPGCTDSLATNYLPLYTEDDGSCTVPVIWP